ncbi:rab GTPase-activating protein 1-like [Pholidichthys leucotaenia]
MMQEVSTVTAFDACDFEQMSEEEILACLVAETEPKFTVPTKKPKLKESRLQIMDDEDPLDKCLNENRRLQQTSHRLEQENDSLACKLITSKVALRSALDKAEDKVLELTKDLAKTRNCLQATEMERQGKEEEAAMLKEVFWRELEKAEQEVKRSSGIITDYKQICSQLTNRLEKQQSAHKEELDSLKSVIKACPSCQHFVKSDELSNVGQRSEAGAQMEDQEMTVREEDHATPRQDERRSENQKDGDEDEELLRAQLKQLEQELAQSKLELVEAKCKIQELEHQKGILANDLQEAKNNWISKAFTSLKPPSSEGLHGISLHREGTPTVNWNLHRVSLPGLINKKLLWPLREKRGNVSSGETVGCTEDRGGP